MVLVEGLVEVHNIKHDVALIATHYREDGGHVAGVDFRELGVFLPRRVGESRKHSFTSFLRQAGRNADVSHRKSV